MFPSKIRNNMPLKGGFETTITSSQISLTGRNFPQLAPLKIAKRGFVMNQHTTSKTEHFRIKTQTNKNLGCPEREGFLNDLESTLQINGKTAHSNTASTGDLPTATEITPSTIAQQPKSKAKLENVTRKKTVFERKPAKLPKLVMAPSMVTGDSKQIYKLRRPSQINDVKDVSVKKLIELRPLADENNSNASPLGSPEPANKHRTVSSSLWFPVDSKNVIRNGPFTEQYPEDSFDNHVRSRVTAYIRNNSSPGSMRTVIDLSKTSNEIKRSNSSEDDKNLKFHFSQLELEVGKSLNPQAVSPTPAKFRGQKTPVPLDLSVSLRSSPVLLRAHLREALKLPANTSPRTNMVSEVVEVEEFSQPLQALKMRKDYAKNLERNWMKRHLIEQRQKKREKQIRQTVSSWIGKRVNMATQDFSKAFYSSDDESSDCEEIHTVGLANQRFSPLKRSPSPYKQASDGNKIFEALDNRPSSQLRLNSGLRGYSRHTDFSEAEDYLSNASLDVQYSDFDPSDDSYAIEILLKDGDLVERRVKNKIHRRARRVRKRFENLVFPESSSEDEREDEKEISNMTDTQIRAVRLKLNKEEEEFESQPCRITSALLRDLRRLNQICQKKQKKKKKKKKKNKEPVQTMSVRERFLHDFGWLLEHNTMSQMLANNVLLRNNLTGSNIAISSAGEDDNTLSGFIQTIDDDIKALRLMDPENIGFKKKVKKEKRRVLRRKKEFQEIYERKLAEARKKKVDGNGKSRSTESDEGDEFTDSIEEEINPDEWECVTETDDESTDEDEVRRKRERRHSFAGRDKPDFIIYDKYIEKPLPPKSRSPTKSYKSAKSAPRRFSKFELSIDSSPLTNNKDSLDGDINNQEKQLASAGVENDKKQVNSDKKKRRKESPCKITKRLASLEDSVENAKESNETLQPTKSPDAELNSEVPLENDLEENNRIATPQPRQGFFFDIEGTEIDCRVLRRTKSWHSLCQDDEEGINLHDLLEGIDIPAKDIKIQIIYRRLKRQRQKIEQQKQQAQQMEEQENDAALETGSDAESVVSKGESMASRNMSFTEESPFMSSILEWNRTNKYKGEFTDQQLDEDIEDLSDLFWEMKNCRYIRWNKREQAIITRLYELDLYDR